MIVARQMRWKVLLPILAFLAALSGFWAPLAVSADEGVNVSSMGRTHGIATGVSQNGFFVCAVWAQFDVESPQAWVRILDNTGATWTPALGQGATQVSNAGNGGVAAVRCAYDSNNNLHIVWQQKSGGGPLEVMHRSRSANGSWSGITTVSGDGDAPDVGADGNGKVWVSYHKFNGDGAPGAVRLRSWQNGSFGTEHSFTASGVAGEPRIAVDNLGYVHFAYKNGNSNRGYAFFNANNNTFSSEVGLPNSNNAGNFSLAVNRTNGDVHAVFSKNLNQVFYTKKTGQGTTNFGGANVIAQAQDRALSPQISWSASRVLVVFDNNNKDRIDYVEADTNGNGWSGIKNLADPAGSANGGGGAESPWVASDPNGNAHIAYAHRGDGTVYFTTLVGYLPEALRCAGFADVNVNGPSCPAITELTNDNVINGYATTPMTYGPNKPVTRAEMSAFLVRGRAWQGMAQGPKSFSDFGALVGELRSASLILANACTNPNDVTTCVAKGYGDGRFGPNDTVTYAQVMSFITRAMNHDGTWRPQPGGQQFYTGVPAVHDLDVRTYNTFAGQVTTVPMPGTEAGWNAPAPRAWVAAVLYQALQTLP